MKNAVIVLVVVALVGVALWILTKPGEPDVVTAVVDAAPAPEPEPEPEPAASPTAEHTPYEKALNMEAAERVKLLAAISEFAAKTRVGAGVENDAAVSEQPPSTPKELKRQVKLFARGTSRQLRTVVRDCLIEARAKQPDLFGKGYNAEMTVDGAPGLGSAVTQVRITGPGGAVEGHALQTCVEQNSFQLHFADKPHQEGPSVFNFPLVAGGGTQ